MAKMPQKSQTGGKTNDAIERPFLTALLVVHLEKAALSTVRAHAASKSNSQVGLFAVIGGNAASA